MHEKILCICFIARKSNKHCFDIAWWFERFSLLSNLLSEMKSFIPHPEVRISHILVLIIEPLSARLISCILDKRSMHLPPHPWPIKIRVRVRKTHRRNDMIKQFKQMLCIPRALPSISSVFVNCIFMSTFKMSAKYTFINVCFFYFTQYAVTHVVMSVETPLGTGIAWTTEVLFLAVRWISGLWKILFQVLGFTLKYLLTLCYLNCYTIRLCLFTAFIIPNHHVIRIQIKFYRVHGRLKNKLSYQILCDYLEVAGEQFLLLLLHWKWKLPWKNIQLLEATNNSLQRLFLFFYTCKNTHRSSHCRGLRLGMLTRLWCYSHVPCVLSNCFIKAIYATNAEWYYIDVIQQS